MADSPFSSSAANRPSDPYDGRDYEVELSALPRSRAPSYVSKNSFWQGNDDEDESLMRRDRTTSYSDGLKGGNATTRVVSVASQTPTTKSNREQKRKTQGWRFGVKISAWTALTVFLLNLTLTIYGASTYTMLDGVGTAFSGSCDTVNSWTTWLHILINALSSILLSASNYTMQCLCSPTRQEVDKAHARGDWMDIGVASMRNIFKISWRRSLLWWLLALSSVPIHLLYNSAIFKSLDANEYQVAVVNTDFLKGDDFAAWYAYPGDPAYADYAEPLTSSEYAALRTIQQTFSADLNNATAVQNLTNSECIAAYGTSFVSGRDHVLAITSAQGNQTNNTMFYTTENIYNLDAGSDELPSYFWICIDLADSDTDCDVTAARRNASDWTVNGKKIEYCLSRVMPSRCKLQFSIHILLTVIIMNACKSISMFMTLWREKDATLVTVGDAMSSFLDTPDELTKGRCLMAKVDVHKGPLRWRLREVSNRPNTQPLPITYYAPLRRRWFAAASVKRWCITLGLCLAGLITGAALLGVGVAAISSYLSSGQSVFSLGFGSVDSRALIDAGLPQGGSSGLVSAVLLANLPQAIVSFLYLTYNGLFTCMLLCHEYSKYAMDSRRKPLRVTSPRGQQRSTYYLQLPYTYSIPLIITSGTLHWLISQSIFLARISVYNNGENTAADDVSEVGYSCLPILSVILLGSFMLIAALGFGFRKFASHIPVAGSCSVALAAAAHRPKDDVDAAFLPVRWGDVHSEGSDEVGHCCFTSEEVHELIPGRLYAGLDPPLTTSNDLDEHGHQRRARVQRELID
ncbi:hypothetical protein LTR36_003019 [Oleoguttula mirabilis]|uniref:DUF6536 domain-containing protein n=1 Tax=Oleoguttula mirabilis TaxID=1507867 RepID=A0AAV9JWC1_9PEZI|nr:hypothetical protein LTR36_003019 [Oleoguttula mirabilis]